MANISNTFYYVTKPEKNGNTFYYIKEWDKEKSNSYMEQSPYENLFITLQKDCDVRSYK